MSYDVKTSPNFKITERPNGRSVENPQEMTLKKGQTMWGFAQEHARKDFNMSPTDLLKSVGDLNPSLNGDFTKIKHGTQVIQLPAKVKEVDLDNKTKEPAAPAAPVEKNPEAQAQARGAAAAADKAAQQNLGRTETVAKTEKKPVKGLQKADEKAKPASIDKEIGDVQAKVDGVAAKQARVAELDKKISHELRKDPLYQAPLSQDDLSNLKKERDSLAGDAKDAQKSLKALEAKLPGAAADLNSLVGKKRNELAAAPASKREALEKELAPLEKSLSTVQGLQLGGAKGMAETLDTHLSTLDTADKGLARLSTTVSEHQAALGSKLNSKLGDEKKTLSDLQGQAALPREKRDGAVRGRDGVVHGSLKDDELQTKISNQQAKVDGLATSAAVNTANTKLGEEKKTLGYLEGQLALPRGQRDAAVRSNMNDDELKSKVKEQKGKVDGLAAEIEKLKAQMASGGGG